MGFKDWVMEGNRSDRTFAQEIKKQIPDQFGHGAWGWGTCFVPCVGWWGLARWNIWLPLVFGAVIIVGSNVGWRLRERKQAEDGSHVRWDPYLDDFCYYAGQLVGIASGIILLVFAALPGAA